MMDNVHVYMRLHIASIYIGKYLYGTNLIQTRAEPPRNKQLFLEYFTWKVLFLLPTANITNKCTFFGVIILIDSNKCNLKHCF